MVTKEEILNYVDNTPENSNRNVLSGMLDNYSGGGGSGGASIITCELSVDEEDRSTLTATKTAGELIAADYVIFYLCPADGIKVFANFLQGSVDINGLYSFYLKVGTDDLLVTLYAESADGYPSGAPDSGEGGGGGAPDSGEGGGKA